MHGTTNIKKNKPLKLSKTLSISFTNAAVDRCLLSMYWKLKENPTYGADLAHWTIVFGPMTQHLGGHQFYSKKNSEV